MGSYLTLQLTWYCLTSYQSNVEMLNILTFLSLWFCCIDKTEGHSSTDSHTLITTAGCTYIVYILHWFTILTSLTVYSIAAIIKIQKSQSNFSFILAKQTCSTLVVNCRLSIFYYWLFVSQLVGQRSTTSETVINSTKFPK